MACVGDLKRQRKIVSCDFCVERMFVFRIKREKEMVGVVAMASFVWFLMVGKV